MSTKSLAEKMRPKNCVWRNYRNEKIWINVKNWENNWFVKFYDKKLLRHYGKTVTYYIFVAEEITWKVTQYCRKCNRIVFCHRKIVTEMSQEINLINN